MIFNQTDQNLHKAFFNPLLKQKIDSLNFVITEKKVAAITEFRFLNTLRQLENYFGLTGWLRNYVKHYAKILNF